MKLARALFTAPTVLGLSASSPPRHVRADRGGVAGGLARADECSSMASRWCRKVPAGSSECRCDVESGQDWPLATGSDPDVGVVIVSMFRQLPVEGIRARAFPTGVRPCRTNERRSWSYACFWRQSAPALVKWSKSCPDRNTSWSTRWPPRPPVGGPERSRHRGRIVTQVAAGPRPSGAGPPAGTAGVIAS